MGRGDDMLRVALPHQAPDAEHCVIRELTELRQNYLCRGCGRLFPSSVEARDIARRSRDVTGNRQSPHHCQLTNTIGFVATCPSAAVTSDARNTTDRRDELAPLAGHANKSKPLTSDYEYVLELISASMIERFEAAQREAALRPRGELVRHL